MMHSFYICSAIRVCYTFVVEQFVFDKEDNDTGLTMKSNISIKNQSVMSFISFFISTFESV